MGVAVSGEHVDLGAHFLQGFLVRHAKALLFVNHQHTPGP